MDAILEVREETIRLDIPKLRSKKQKIFRRRQNFMVSACKKVLDSAAGSNASKLNEKKSMSLGIILK